MSSVCLDAGFLRRNTIPLRNANAPNSDYPAMKRDTFLGLRIYGAMNPDPHVA